MPEYVLTSEIKEEKRSAVVVVLLAMVLGQGRLSNTERGSGFVGSTGAVETKQQPPLLNLNLPLGNVSLGVIKTRFF